MTSLKTPRLLLCYIVSVLKFNCWTQDWLQASCEIKMSTSQTAANESENILCIGQPSKSSKNKAHFCMEGDF